MRKLIGTAAAVFACSLLMSMTAFADRLDTSKGAPEALLLDESGFASWRNGDAEEAEKYTVILERENSSGWREYRTKTAYEESCEFNFGSTGYYRIRVRAHFYDDTYSDYAGMQGSVLITRDDVSGGGSGGVPDDWGWVYNPGPGYDANGIPYGEGPARPVDVNRPQGWNNGWNGGYGPHNGYGAHNGGAGYPNNHNYNNGSPSGTPNAGWVCANNGRWWYKKADGSYPRHCWEWIDEKWYFFDPEGYRQSGWIFWKNNWYLCLPDGQMATGWQNVNERWYYLNESGVMQTGYQMIDGKIYYLDATGARVQNGHSPEGHLFDANGVMIA